jgi:5'-methylthioadenosine phosphorylase
MAGNAEIARATVVALIKALPATRAPSPIDTVLDTALITAPEMRDYTRLDAICGRVLRTRA